MIYHLRYNGQIDSNGIPNGIGTAMSIDMPIEKSKAYTGEWKDSKFHGHGILFEKNTKYIGDFWNGKKNGIGKLMIYTDETKKDITTYEGIWNNDYLLFGKVVYQNGNWYEGTFKNYNMFEGTCYTSNMKLKGLWNNNILMSGTIHYKYPEQFSLIKTLYIDKYIHPEQSSVYGEIEYINGIKLKGLLSIEHSEKYIIEGMRTYPSGKVKYEKGKYKFLDDVNYLVSGLKVLRDGSIMEGTWNQKLLFTGYNSNFVINKSMRYNGYVKDSTILHGFGKLYCCNKQIYEGVFDNNKFHGQGKFMESDLNNIEIIQTETHLNDVLLKNILINNKYHKVISYEGEWYYNNRCGYGEIILQGINVSRVMIKGNFVDNVLNGNGKMIDSKGNTYEGEFKDNMFSGNGVYYEKKSGTYSGTWLNGKRHGRFVYVANNDNTSIVQFWQNNKQCSNIKRLRDNDNDDGCHVNKKKRTDISIPNDYVCPITLDIMNNPVICSDGNTYEKSAITTWCKKHDYTSPITREKIQKKMYVNRTLKNMIDLFVINNNNNI